MMSAALLALTPGGENVADIPGGPPDAASVTVFANPPTRFTFTVTVPDAPAATVSDVADRLNVKPAAAVTVALMVTLWFATLPPALP